MAKNSLRRNKIADYNSQYTGTEIETAITRVLNGPAFDSASGMYAVGVSPTDSTLFKKPGIIFSGTGSLECSYLLASHITTNDAMWLK